MGIYLNPGNDEYKKAVNSEIYVDKTGLIAFTNRILNTEQRNICVSRPRRFGKSMAANMLVAYYDKSCDSKELFCGLNIADDESFERHINKYNVIHINMIDIISRVSSMDEMIDYLQRRILWDIKKEYADLDCFDWNDLVEVMSTIYSEKKQSFIIIIDEWDCIFRKFPDGEHLALNMFDEYSMTNQRELAEFTGFTGEEVQKLCVQYDMSFDSMKQWYDGYDLKGVQVYNPRSVVMSLLGHDFDSYWTKTETYEALKKYIQLDMYNLKELVTRLIAGESVPVNPNKFQNDMTTLESADDVLTLLVHLGYLTYDFYNETVSIPNQEVQNAMQIWSECLKIE